MNYIFQLKFVKICDLLEFFGRNSPDFFGIFRFIPDILIKIIVNQYLNEVLKKGWVLSRKYFVPECSYFVELWVDIC